MLPVIRSGENQSQFAFKGKGVRKVTIGLEYTKASSASWQRALAVSREGPARAWGPPTRLCQPRSGVLARLTVRVKAKLLLRVLWLCVCVCAHVCLQICVRVCVPMCLRKHESLHAHREWGARPERLSALPPGKSEGSRSGVLREACH